MKTEDEFAKWLREKESAIKEIEMEIRVGKDIYKRLFSNIHIADKKKVADEKETEETDNRPRTIVDETFSVIQGAKVAIKQDVVVKTLNKKGFKTNVGTVSSAIRRLVATGKVMRISRGIYKAVEKGMAFEEI